MIKRIYIEITNVCQLSCSFCLKNTRQPRFMSVQEFEHIISQTSSQTNYVYLHVQGEPLLHPQLNEIMDICRQYGCHVQLVTNALLLKEHMDLLSCPALRKISFSLQSVEYHDEDIEQFMDPIISFIEQASANGHPYCELRFWRDDQMEMSRTAQCLGIIRRRYHAVNDSRKNNEKILEGVYVDYANAFAWPDENDPEENDRGTCLGGIEQIAILCGGSVIPCCLDAQGTMELGNIFEESLEDILQSERYLKLTDGFRHHFLNERMCRKCTFRKRFG